jgi:hypothetical protein
MDAEGLLERTGYHSTAKSTNKRSISSRVSTSRTNDIKSSESQGRARCNGSIVEEDCESKSDLDFPLPYDQTEPKPQEQELISICDILPTAFILTPTMQSEMMKFKKRFSDLHIG